MRAICRSNSRAKSEFEIFDLSLGGCMIKSRTWMPEVGESVWVQIEQLEGMPASVAWVDGGKVGLAFEAMLHEAVLARINATYTD